jgi:hypothetical protein
VRDNAINEDPAVRQRQSGSNAGHILLADPHVDDALRVVAANAVQFHRPHVIAEDEDSLILFHQRANTQEDGISKISLHRNAP